MLRNSGSLWTGINGSLWTGIINKEAELKDFLKYNFDDQLGKAIEHWWLVHSATTPVWDLISTCTIKGKRGLLLVEAKAHWDELNVKDKCGSTNSENIEKIAKAINEAKNQINEIITPATISISIDKCYQLSNRVAHAWWLANRGIPVVLMYLGILDSTDMENGKRKIFSKPEEWDSCVHDYTKHVDVDSLLKADWVDCGKSEFKLIVKTVKLKTII